MNNEFAGKPFQLMVIDGSYAVIGCSLMGAVLMAFDPQVEPVKPCKLCKFSP
jgi:hypothetical protein